MRVRNRQRLTRLPALVALALLAVPAAAAAHDRPDGHHDRDRGPSGAVFVQTNEATGNRILAYRRARDGMLGSPRSYSTGGVGTGRIRTSSQGPVVLSADGDRLFTDVPIDVKFGVG